MFSHQTASTLMRAHIESVSDVPARRKHRDGHALTIIIAIIAAGLILSAIF